MSRMTSHVDAPVEAPDKDDADTPDDVAADAPEDAGDGASPAPGRFAGIPPRGRLLMLALLVLLVLVPNIWVLQRQWAGHQREQQNAVAVATAQQITTEYFTLRSDTSQQWVDSLLAKTTGTFKQQVTQYRSAVQEVLKQAPRTSVGTPIQAALVERDGDTATVLVAENVVITQEAAKPADAKAAQQFYRVRATMTRTGDRWLLSNLEVVTS